MTISQQDRPLLLTVAETSEYLGIPRSSLYREYLRKRLPVVQLGPRAVRVHRAEVEKLAEELRQEAHSHRLTGAV